MDWTTTTNRSIDRHRQPTIYHLSIIIHPPTNKSTHNDQAPFPYFSYA